MSMNIRTLTEVTIVAAFAMVLSLIPADIGWYQISLGTLPVAVLAIRRGTVAGLTAGFLWGILHVLFKVYILSPTQFMIEYVFAFFVVGLAGLLAPMVHSYLSRDERKQAATSFAIGGVLGTFVKYFFHFIAGYYFWGSYAPEGMSPFIYSLAVNGVSFLMTALYVALVGFILVMNYPQLFIAKEHQGYQ